jgi:hypothetical protein
MPDKTPELNLGPEFDGVSQIYDLSVENPVDNKNVGLYTSLLNMAAIKLRDELLNQQFHEEFANIYQDIFDTLQSPNAGYLLEVVVYVDPTTGIPNIPQGRIINSIGVGTEALDAMANYMNTDRMIPGGRAPNFYQSNSSALWITKSDGKLTARSIDKSIYNNFLDKANNEAQKRKLMGQWIALNPASNLKEIRLGEFWQEQEKLKLVLIDNEETRKKIEKLTDEMSALQAQANELYKQYQVTQEKMVESQRMLSTLGAISTIAGLVKSGIQLNNLLTSSDKQLASNADSHLLSLEETTTLENSRLTNLGIENTKLTTTVREYWDNIGRLHTELSNSYQIVVEPMPTLEDNPLLRP